MIRLDVALLPRDIDSERLKSRVAIVFDVLRATTSMTAALAAGVGEIRIFPNVGEVRKAAAENEIEPQPLLCGEEKCFKPDGFHLGNSPAEFGRSLAGQTLYMSTTNGTRALLAARDAELLLVGALVNASAVAQAARDSRLDVMLVCAGTDGRIAIEDVIGAGAVIDALRQLGAVAMESDAARMALMLFEVARGDLMAALSAGAGGINVINAGLSADIEFAASLNRFGDVVGRVEGNIIRRATPTV